MKCYKNTGSLPACISCARRKKTRQKTSGLFNCNVYQGNKSTQIGTVLTSFGCPLLLLRPSVCRMTIMEPTAQLTTFSSENVQYLTASTSVYHFKNRGKSAVSYSDVDTIFFRIQWHPFPKTLQADGLNYSTFYAKIVAQKRWCCNE